MKAIHTPPLQDRVEAVLQRAAKPGSVLRLALDRRCSRQALCQRGPAGCGRCSNHS